MERPPAAKAASDRRMALDADAPVAAPRAVASEKLSSAADRNDIVAQKYEVAGAAAELTVNSAALVTPPLVATAPARTSASLEKVGSETRQQAFRTKAPAVETSRAMAADASVAGGDAVEIGLAAAARGGGKPFSDSSELNVQTLSFMLPMTNGAWVLQQNVRVRASVTEDYVSMDISNHGALPVTFQLLPRTGTNILRSFEIEAGAATNIIQRTR
jgi:hypothetical protein